MGKFLSDQELSTNIKEISKGKNKRFAVAFLGDGAFDFLFGGEETDARVICDLSMGATNPTEIKTLQKNGAKVKHIESFHGKVYLSDKGVVVTSANASRNGLGFEGDAKHVETGVFHKVGSEVFEGAGRWFEKVWGEAKKIKKADLDSAKVAWQDKVLARKSAHPRKAYPKNMTLLEALKECPDEFGSIKFVITWEALSEEELDEYVSNLRKNAFKDLKPDGFINYRSFDSTKFEDFCDFEEDIEKWPCRFVSLYLADENNPTIRLCSKGSIETLENVDEDDGMTAKSLHLAHVHSSSSDLFSEIRKFDIDGENSISQLKKNSEIRKNKSNLGGSGESENEGPLFYSAQELHDILFGKHN